MTLVSYWQAETTDFRTRLLRSLPRRVQVAVVGGGIMGAATAYWLARTGLNVLLLEADLLCSGATGRNAGLMLAGGSPLEDPGPLQLVLESEHIAADYRVPGHLALARSKNVWDRIRTEAAHANRDRTQVYALERSTCEEVLQMRLCPDFLGGRWLPAGGMVHPVRLTCGLVEAAERYGASIATQTRVLRVAPSTQGATHVQTSRGTVDVDDVVYACGAAAPGMAPALAAAFAPVRGQLLATEPLPPVFMLGLAVDWGAVYWRQTSSGAVVLGGCRNVDAATEVGCEERVNPRIQDALSNFLSEAFPDLPDVTVSRRWAGIMDNTQDGKPVVGRVPGAEREWVIAGFGGHGLPPALNVGKALAEAIASRHLGAALDQFDPARFAATG